MTKNELVQQLATETGLTQQKVETLVRSLTKTIQDKLRNGDKVSITGFGTFYAKNRNSRKVRNPVNGEWIQVPAMKMPKFRAGESLKRAVR